MGINVRSCDGVQKINFMSAELGRCVAWKPKIFQKYLKLKNTRELEEWLENVVFSW